MTDATTPQDNERRRYFRLNDEAIVEIQTLSDHECAQQSEHADNALDDLDVKIGIALQNVRSKYPDVADALDLIQQKLNRLSNDPNASHELTDDTLPRLSDINLSACGMAIASEKTHDQGGHVGITLTLLPSNTKLELVGAIVAIDPSEHVEKPHLLRIDFIDIKEPHRELLLQHLFQLQSKHIKVRQDQLDANT